MSKSKLGNTGRLGQSHSEDTKNKIIGFHEVSRGTIDQSLASPREVFKRALINNAPKIILAHNHPSGELEPSNADKSNLKRIRN